MDTEATTPAQPEVEGAANTDMDVGEAAQALLSKWTAKQPQAEEAPAEPTEPQATADAGTEGEAEAEAPAEEADFELDVGGAKFKLPKGVEEPARAIAAKVKEIEAGATRKFQEAAELRKATETERAAVAEMRKIAEANADLLADYRTVSRRIQQLEQIDIAATDAETLARYNAEYTQLTAASKRIEAAYTQSVQQIKAKETEAFRARQEHAERIVAQRIKGWGPDLQRELAEYAVGRGAPVEALNSITEPWMVEILADAAYGRKMREHKATAEKRVVQAPPTLKPSASQGQTNAKAKVEQAMTRLKSSGSLEDAAAAILARSKMRR